MTAMTSRDSEAPTTEPQPRSGQETQDTNVTRPSSLDGARQNANNNYPQMSWDLVRTVWQHFGQ